MAYNKRKKKRMQTALYSKINNTTIQYNTIQDKTGAKGLIYEG